MSLVLEGEEKLYIELDNGKKVSCSNCLVSFADNVDVVVSRTIGGKRYTTQYYARHIIYFTTTLDDNHGDDNNE